MSDADFDGNSNIKDHYPTNGRVVLHIDMNAFYCSVHEAIEPHKYHNKPIAVAGSVELRKGIVVTSSYAARAQGVRTGMTVRQAMKCSPDLIIIAPDFDLYRAFSKQFMDIVYSFSPILEAVSIDECYVDITGSKLFGTPLEIAHKIQQRIRSELALPCSIGVAPNKLLAKMASDMKKPNGITVLRRRDVPRLLWDKPCREMFGIGRKTAEKLKLMHIRTIGELAQADEDYLVRMLGINGSWLKQAANGMDASPVKPIRERRKSIGHMTTLPKDMKDVNDLRRVFLNLADQTSRRMRRQSMVCSTIQILVRDPDMSSFTRAQTMQAPTENTDEIYAVAWALFTKHWEIGKPVRLLGITLQSLQEKQQAVIQLDLFEYEASPKKEQLNKVMDAIRDKYGEQSILTAGMLGDDPSTLIRDHKHRGTSLQMDHLLERHNLDEQ